MGMDMAKITFRPSGKTTKTRAGLTVVSAARAARVAIPQRCGGHASCLLCKVILEAGELSQPTVLERRKLREQDLAQGVRLACQAKVAEKDCVIRVPENKLKSVVAALLEREQKDEEQR
jgi:2Fe-2S ferredoxin